MTIVGKKDFIKHIDAHDVQNPMLLELVTVIAALSLSYLKTGDIEEQELQMRQLQLLVKKTFFNYR